MKLNDQFALAHHLMTPKFKVRGIVAGHFEKNPQEYGPGNTVDASYEEILKVMGLMGLSGEYPVWRGARGPLPDERTAVPSEGADAIIAEAMREDPLPLYVVFQGCLTDLASRLPQGAPDCGAYDRHLDWRRKVAGGRF